MRPRLRPWARARLAGWLTRVGDAEDLGHTVQRVQRQRERVEEVEEAVLHFWLLPAREDVRSLRRRVHRLRRELDGLDEAVGRLERSLGRRGGAR